MVSEFNLIGLSKKKSVTCSVVGGSQQIFWPKVEMSQDVFNSFWNYWQRGSRYIAKIEHEGFYSDGSPINGRLVEIVDNS